MSEIIDGPYFEDFEVGDEFSAPSITLTDGMAAAYQAISADRMRLPLDKELSQKVTGNSACLAHPSLVLNVVNGQTTYASQHVKGNLFYRGLLHKAPVFIGDTLTTVTKIVGLRQNKIKPGRPGTGMVALEMETRNQRDELVLHYWRCPMIPTRDPDADTGRADNFDWISTDLSEQELVSAMPAHWDISALQSRYTGLAPLTLLESNHYEIAGKDTVTAAPELVRLTLNIAYAHSDATRSYLGKRLVYGGHTIALAHQALTRAFPAMLGIIAWQACDHLGPVLEEDIIATSFSISNIRDYGDRGKLYALAVKCTATRQSDDGLQTADVLAWQPYVWSL
ncbi:MAG: MaoC family dehydratase [Gammaproteobacteria bacterium]